MKWNKILEQKPTSTIVVLVDGSSTAKLAVDGLLEKLRKASLGPSSCRVHLVHCVELRLIAVYPNPFNMQPERPNKDYIKDVEVKYRSRLNGSNLNWDYTALADTLPDCEQAVRFATDRAADLIVVGSTGLGRFLGPWVGDMSHYVRKHARCPVVTVKKDARSQQFVYTQHGDQDLLPSKTQPT